MPVLSLVTYTIGTSIAKAIAKLWLKDQGILPDVIPDLIDLVKGTAEGARDARQGARRIEDIGVQVVQQMQPIFDDAGAGADSRATVARELAITLAAAHIHPRLLAECNFDPALLADHLKSTRPDATKLLSAAESALYERLLIRAADPIIEIADKLQAFETSSAATSLQDIDKILKMLTEIWQRPAQADQEFTKKYLTIVQKQLDKLELFDLPEWDESARAQRLTRVYISLQYERQQQFNAPDRETQTQISNDGEQPTRRVGEALGAKRTIVEKGDIDQLIAFARRVVIRGEAGSGKSTLLQWLAVRSAARSFTGQLADWNDTIPFFIRLRERVDLDFPAPEEFPKLIAQSISGSMPTGWVHRQLDSDRALVLIDGIDELPQAQRNGFLEALAQLVVAYPLARYIVTSRPAVLKNTDWPEWSEWTTSERFTDATLQPLTPEQVNLLIQQWHEALLEKITDSDDRAEIQQLPGMLRRTLRLRPPLRRLTTNPLLCSMICALHRDRRQNLPNERLKLYENCVELLLTKRDRGRIVPLGPEYAKLSPGQQRALVENFAYWMMRNNYSDVSVGDADAQFASKLPAVNAANETGEKARRFFVHRTNLLREPVEGRIDFTHRTFEEFLAAHQALKESDLGFLVSKATDDQWRELIILAAGIARPKEVDRFLRDLVDLARGLPDAPLRHRVLLLAVACLETCVELDPATRTYVIEQASSLFPPKDDGEVRLVAAAGDPSIPLLVYNPQHTTAEAVACVRALAQIGTTAAMHAIAAYMHHPEPRIREVIVESWDLFDRTEFARHILAKTNTLRLTSLSTLEGFEHLLNLAILTIRELAPDIDLSPLAHIASLHSIYIGPEAGPDFLAAALTWSNPRRVSSEPMTWETTDKALETISTFAALRQVSISSSLITNITALTHLRELTHLQIAHGSYRNLDLLASLTELKHLHHFGDTIADLSPLSKLTKLTQLFLQDNNINDLAQLSNLTSLTQLLIQSANVTDLTPLAKLTELTGLWLAGGNITDLTPLAELTGLTQLQLVGKNITDLSPITSLPRLTHLQLHCSSITDLAPLASLTTLTNLYVDASGHTDMSLAPLAALIQLETVQVNGVLVSEIKALQALLPKTKFSL